DFLGFLVGGQKGLHLSVQIGIVLAGTLNKTLPFQGVQIERSLKYLGHPGPTLRRHHVTAGWLFFYFNVSQNATRFSPPYSKDISKNESQETAYTRRSRADRGRIFWSTRGNGAGCGVTPGNQAGRCCPREGGN